MKLKRLAVVVGAWVVVVVVVVGAWVVVVDGSWDVGRVVTWVVRGASDGLGTKTGLRRTKGSKQITIDLNK